MGRTLQRYKSLFDQLRKTGAKPVYLLYGSEEYIKKEFVGELIKSALGEKNRAFNLDIFHGDEFQRDDFDDRVSSFPLFSERRMVIIKKFEALALSNKDFVLARIHNIPDSLVVVIETGVDKMDNARLKSLKKLVDTHGLSFRFQALSEAETVERLQGRLRRE
ncbi:MAG: hypothetical protein OEN01_15330, partial [Candidatus Krumholzibacteria bacterium]|nr:hypothetical protein [Candidatus Krumholzibacteria bacterium]